MISSIMSTVSRANSLRGILLNKYPTKKPDAYQDIQKNKRLVEKYANKITPEEILELPYDRDLSLFLNKVPFAKILQVWEKILTSPERMAPFLKKMKEENRLDFYTYAPQIPALILESSGMGGDLTRTYGLHTIHNVHEGLSSGRNEDEKAPYSKHDLISLIIRVYWRSQKESNETPVQTPEIIVPAGIAYHPYLNKWFAAQHRLNWFGELIGKEPNLSTFANGVPNPKGAKISELPFHDYDFYEPVNVRGKDFHLPSMKIDHRGGGSVAMRRRDGTMFVDPNGQVIPAHSYDDLYKNGLFEPYVRNLNYQADTYLSKALDTAIKKLPKDEPARIVELGAGDGIVLKTFRKKYTKHKTVPVAGLDIFESAKRCANKKSKPYRYNQYWVGHFSDSPNIQTKFKDFNPNILLVGSVAHRSALPDILAAFNALKPNSLFIINYPEKSSISLESTVFQAFVDTMKEQGAIKPLQTTRSFHRWDVDGKAIYFKVLIAQKLDTVKYDKNLV